MPSKSAKSDDSSSNSKCDSDLSQNCNGKYHLWKDDGHKVLHPVNTHVRNVEDYQTYRLADKLSKYDEHVVKRDTK